MHPTPRNHFRRTLLAVIAAVVGIIVLMPLLAIMMGDTNREDQLLGRIRRIIVIVGTVETPIPVAVLPPPTKLVPTKVPPPPTPEPPTVTPVPVLVNGMPAKINGVPISKIIVLSPAASENIKAIYAQGQAMGRDPHALAKVGDSTMLYPPLLAAFDTPDYHLAAFNPLEATIDYHAGSFARVSAAVKKGMHTWTEFDPTWSNPDLCSPNEAPLPCEIRTSHASIAIIRLGANDYFDPQRFHEQLRSIATFCIAQGVIPVPGTKPDRSEGSANTINNLVRRTASELSIPLWDYDMVVGTVPGRGLEPDAIHMRAGGSHDYRSLSAFSSGDSIEDLTALMMLHAIRQVLDNSGPTASQ